MENEQQGAQTVQNQENQVSKEDFQKLASDNAALKQGLETLQQQLTDPDYVAFIEGRRNQGQQQTQQTQAPNFQNVDLSKMTVAQLQQVLAFQQNEFVTKVLAPQLQGMNQSITNMAAKLELKDAESAYEDFGEYRQDIYNILSTAGNELTIDQAYHIARSNRPPKEGGDSQKVETPKPMTLINSPYRTQSSSEKPGQTIPVDGDGIKKFSTKESAALDAWSQVAAKHGISGDTI